MPPTSSATNIRAERPRGWRAHRQGRESTGNGGPGNRPSERPISNRGERRRRKRRFSGGPKSSEMFAATVLNSNRAVHLAALTRFRVPSGSPDWLKRTRMHMKPEAEEE